MDTTSARISAAEQLHELLATDQEIVDFLDDLAITCYLFIVIVTQESFKKSQQTKSLLLQL